MIYTVEDIREIAKVVHAEATGEPDFGKILVARVVMNRYEANPGMTLREIINRPNAFAKSETFDSEDLRAAWAATKENRFPGIFSFFNPETSTNRDFVNDKMGNVVIEVGNHVFCE